MIFDLFSSEYGWKTKDILKLTMREISWRADSINARQMDEFKINAQLHGHDIKLENDRPEVKTSELSKEEQAAIDAAFQERLKGN